MESILRGGSFSLFSWGKRSRWASSRASYLNRAASRRLPALMATGPYCNGPCLLLLALLLGSFLGGLLRSFLLGHSTSSVKQKTRRSVSRRATICSTHRPPLEQADRFARATCLAWWHSVCHPAQTRDRLSTPFVHNLAASVSVTASLAHLV